MHNSINFFPYYKDLLLKGKKNTTIRLHEKKHISEGDVVSITSGWSDKNLIELFKAEIISIDIKKVKDLDEKELQGESPDCKSPEAVQYVLGCIYKKVISSDDKIMLIKFKKV